MKIIIKNTLILASGANEPITGDIAIDGNTIMQAGDVPDTFSADVSIDGRGFIAMPGLVNAHAHSPMGLLRNLADDLAFSDWLFGNIIPAEGKLTEEDIYWGAQLGIAEMLKSGITCFADMYLHMEAVARAVSETGIRANLSFGPITSEVRGNGLIVERDKCAALIKKWNNAEDERIKASVEIHSVYLFDRPSITEAACLAKELGVGVQIHLSESYSELESSFEKYKLSPVKAAYELGVFEVPVIAAHCVHLNKTDIELLVDNKVGVAHCPSSNLKLGNGIAPIPMLMDMGTHLCIGTDGSASNNNLNMFEELHLAALLHKGFTKDPECMPASSVLDMATVNGAKALGFDRLGTIEKGGKADIILIDTNKPHICPLNNARSAVVYSAQAGDVDTVIVDGEILVRGGRLVRMDEELIMSNVRAIAKRLQN